MMTEPPCCAILRAIAALAPDRRVEVIADARRLHRLLFRQGPGLPVGRAGRFRRPTDPGGGAVVMVTATQHRPLLLPGLGAERLGPAMRGFRDQMRAVLTMPPADEAVPRLLVHMMAQLLLIHPFADGNGRTSRLMVAAAAAHLGCALTPGWTVAPRPYGPGFNFLLHAYPRSPQPLQHYMRRFFAAEGQTAP